ncbi:hypothetical protein FB45DRAFT_1030866 [Roridomyces roridus]|uniref:REM-1 domain-containing protein n=1 Tax=Roridomyces roridus TaxID=1738132 RepID=A0AAD7BLL8_9AGAR|nr:hypothetical protein FB45DRAFT_1030866 [Roridomyces roridus]
MLRAHDTSDVDTQSFYHRQESDLDQKILEVSKHIGTERKILEASHSLRQSTTNPEVLSRNEARIKETERSLRYFEATLRELQARKAQESQSDG